MTEDRKLASRSPADSGRSTSAAADKRLGSGRAGSSAPSSLEDALRALAAARSELAVVRTERDRLQRELASLGAMQTETIALTSDDEATGISETLPTLDDLMAGLNTFQEATTESSRSDSSDHGVMLSPDLMFEPDDADDDPRTRPIVTLNGKGERSKNGARADAADRQPAAPAAPIAARTRAPAEPAALATPAASAVSAAAAPAASAAPAAQLAPSVEEDFDPDTASSLVVVAALEAAAAVPAPRTKNSRLLVFVDAEPPIKYPLYKPVMTIGRSETADIRVDGDYISRVHARVTTDDDGAVTAEDVASKNGIRVNGQEVKSHVLRHGDVLSLGKLHFTFIDTTAADNG